MSPGLAAFKLSFQVSPIILVNGIANAIPGQMLPIIAITEALNFFDGILSGGENINLDSFFANYVVIPGGTMIDQQIGKYPFANQSVAANAVIAQPLRVSLLMICPARTTTAGYAVKLATMISLKNTIAQHNASGGTYTIITPSVFYTNCVLTGIEDASTGESKQPQNAWRWNFEQPLLTQTQAASALQALNGTMSRITGGLPSTGALSGLESVFQPASVATPGIIPSAAGAVSGGTALGKSLLGINF